jgi:hypothetical protein
MYGGRWVAAQDLDVGFRGVVPVGEDSCYRAGGASHARQNPDRRVGEVCELVVELAGLLRGLQPVC